MSFENFKEPFKTLARQFQSGEITLAEFEAEVKKFTASLHSEELTVIRADAVHSMVSMAASKGDSLAKRVFSEDMNEMLANLSQEFQSRIALPDKSKPGAGLE